MVSFLEGNAIETEPNLLFDSADSSAIHPQAYWGLRRFGPFDKTISEIRIGLIAPISQIAHLRDLIRELHNGVPIFPGGMQQFFGCDLIVTKEQTVDGIATSDYEKAGSNFVASTDPRDVDVVVSFVPRTERYFSNTPYYRLKAILAANGFASQMVTENTFTNLKWSYLNLASAIFAKAGGTPWVLQSEMPNTDIILGISLSNFVSYRNRAGERPRYVGYVNVFDSYGRWMFFEGIAQPYSKEERIKNLEQLLLRALQKFKAEKGVTPKKFAIHYYKKFGSEEIEATFSVLSKQISDFKVAFISIDDSHPFRLYDKRTEDGSFPRGYYAYLDKNEALLSTTGFTSISKHRMGTPKLLHIRLHQRPNEFTNIDEIVYQVLCLTKLDWATATPLVREPVTLQFSREVAYLSAAISEQEWSYINRPEVSTILSRRTWFI
jgi:argonaute-like protein implicated in RNA metabolism and viral defense